MAFELGCAPFTQRGHLSLSARFEAAWIRYGYAPDGLLVCLGITIDPYAHGYDSDRARLRQSGAI